jgi:hypothetical protein
MGKSKMAKERRVPKKTGEGERATNKKKTTKGTLAFQRADLGEHKFSSIAACVSTKTGQKLSTNIVAHWGTRGGVSALQRVWFICEDCCPGMSWQFVYERVNPPDPKTKPIPINTLSDYVSCIAAWFAKLGNI